MRKSLTNFILKIYSITLVLGVALGDIAVYLNERYQRIAYDDNWDNPFSNFIFFLLIGIGESIVPLLIFYLVVKVSLSIQMPYKRLLIYFAGVICTLFPFYTLYYMVNEGGHRANVIMYACCCLLSLLISYFWANANLNNLLQNKSEEKE
jgi:hypothetical protein